MMPREELSDLHFRMARVTDDLRTIMFGEGGAKRQISGIVFGGGLALFAGQFLTWLF